MRHLALGVSGLLLLALALFTGARVLWLLLYFAAAAYALAYLWVWLQTRGLDVQVESQSLRPQVGHPLRLKVTTRERLGLPRVALRFQLLAGQSRTPHLDGTVLDLRPRGSFQWTESVRHHQRGLNVIGSLTVTASDPLGLVRLSRRVGDPHTILVYPNVAPLSSGLSLGSAALGESGGPSATPSASASAAGVREHRPGDSLNRIHWPSTARMGRLMSKEFDSGGHTGVWLFLDLQASTQRGRGLESTEEYGVVIAASLAKTLIDSGQQVGMVAQGNVLYDITPDRDTGHLWRILEALSLVKAEGSVPLPALLAEKSLHIAQGSLAIVVAPGPTRPQTDAFSLLNRRGISVAPVFLEPGSFEDPPDAGALKTAGASDVIRRGDHVAHSLANIMDRLAY